MGRWVKIAILFGLVFQASNAFGDTRRSCLDSLRENSDSLSSSKTEPANELESLRAELSEVASSVLEKLQTELERESSKLAVQDPQVMNRVRQRISQIAVPLVRTHLKPHRERILEIQGELQGIAAHPSKDSRTEEGRNLRRKRDELKKELANIVSTITSSASAEIPYAQIFREEAFPFLQNYSQQLETNGAELADRVFLRFANRVRIRLVALGVDEAKLDELVIHQVKISADRIQRLISDRLQVADPTSNAGRWVEPIVLSALQANEELRILEWPLRAPQLERQVQALEHDDQAFVRSAMPSLFQKLEKRAERNAQGETTKEDLFTEEINYLSLIFPKLLESLHALPKDEAGQKTFISAAAGWALLSRDLGLSGAIKMIESSDAADLYEFLAHYADLATTLKRNLTQKNPDVSDSDIAIALYSTAKILLEEVTKDSSLSTDSPVARAYARMELGLAAAQLPENYEAAISRLSEYQQALAREYGPQMMQLIQLRVESGIVKDARSKSNLRKELLEKALPLFLEVLEKEERERASLSPDRIPQRRRILGHIQGRLYLTQIEVTKLPEKWQRIRDKNVSIFDAALPVTMSNFSRSTYISVDGNPGAYFLENVSRHFESALTTVVSAHPNVDPRVSIESHRASRALEISEITISAVEDLRDLILDRIVAEAEENLERLTQLETEPESVRPAPPAEQEKTLTHDDETKARIREMIVRYKAEPSIELRNQILENYLELISYHAERIARKNDQIDVDDLKAEGFVGAIQALESFDLSRNTDFVTHANRRISGAMLDYLRSIDPLSRGRRTATREAREMIDHYYRIYGEEPTDAELLDFGIHMYEMEEAEVTRMIEKHKEAKSTASLNAEDPEIEAELNLIVPDYREHSPSQDLESNDLFQYLTSGFSRADKMIVHLYFFEGLTMAEIGTTLGISKSLVNKRLGNLKQIIQARLLRSPELAGDLEGLIDRAPR